MRASQQAEAYCDPGCGSDADCDQNSNGSRCIDGACVCESDADCDDPHGLDYIHCG